MFKYVGYIEESCPVYDEENNETGEEIHFILRIKNIWVSNSGDWGFHREDLDKALEEYPNNMLSERQKNYILDYLEDNYYIDDDYYWYTNGDPCAYTNFDDNNNIPISEYDIIELYLTEESCRRLKVRFDKDHGEWGLVDHKGNKFSSLYWAATAPNVKLIVVGNSQKGDKLDLSNIDTRAERI